MQGQTQGNPLEQPGIQPPQESQPKQRGQNQPQLQPQQPAEDTGCCPNVSQWSSKRKACAILFCPFALVYCAMWVTLDAMFDIDIGDSFEFCIERPCDRLCGTD